MNFITKSAIAGLIALAASAAQALPTVNVYNSTTNPELPAGTLLDFNSASTGNCASTGYSSCSGTWTIYNATVPNQTTTPGGTGNFLSVPNPNSNGSATFTLGSAQNYFGLLWGTIDSYNTLSFNNGYSITGSQLAALIPSVTANGSMNRYVTFSFGAASGFGDFTSITFASTDFAFESDNHTYKRVPEPGTLALFGIGLIGMAFVTRRRRFN